VRKELTGLYKDASYRGESWPPAEQCRAASQSGIERLGGALAIENAEVSGMVCCAIRDKINTLVKKQVQLRSR